MIRFLAWIETKRKLIEQVDQLMEELRLSRSAQDRALMEKEAVRNLTDASLTAKNTYLANLSHDLRTPITAILGFSSLARRMDLPPKTQHYLKRIVKAAEDIRDIINHVLDLSKIEANMMKVDQVEFLLQDVLARVVNVTALMASGQVNVPGINDFSTQGLGVAIGTQAGVAGSVGINVITINTQASIGANTAVTSSGGLNVQAANDETLQNIAFTLAVGSDAGAGAAVNVNVLNNPTNAFLDSNVHANVADMTQITAESSLNPSIDPIPNSTADTIVATGNALTEDETLGINYYDVSGINGTVINTATPPPFVGEPVSGPGIPTGTVIVANDSKPFTGNLTFGSNVITSDDTVFLNPLETPKVGETVSGPGIVPTGTTITSISTTLSGGTTITLSLPAIANGSAPLTATRLVLFNPSSPLPTTGPVPLTETPVDILSSALSSLHPTNFSAGGGASSGGAGVAGSFIVNVINQTTHAYSNT